MTIFILCSIFIILIIAAAVIGYYLGMKQEDENLKQEKLQQFFMFENRRSEICRDRLNLQYQQEVEAKRIGEMKQETESLHKQLLMVLNSLDANWIDASQRELELRAQVEELKRQLNQARQRSKRVEKQSKNRV